MPETPEDTFARKSISWRHAAGVLAVTVLAWRLLIRPVSDYCLAYYGLPVPPPSPPLDLSEVLALIGLPVGTSYAEKLAK